MIAIVCDTPYQLMSAVLTASSISKDEELIFFINSYLYFKEQKFSYSADHKNIYKICYYGRAHMGAGKLLFGLANPLNMLKHIDGFEKNLNITAIIASRTTYIATYLYNYQIKLNPNLKLFLVEEGIGEYTGNLTHTRFTKVCSMLKRKTHLDYVNTAYFSAPALFPYKTSFKILKVPEPNPTSREIIESMFNLQNIENPLNTHDCIYLSEPVSVDLKNEETKTSYEADEEEIMQATLNVAGQENLIIKVHPIDPNFKCDTIKTFYSRVPMESLVFKTNCASKVFISLTSTAMLTPKLLFNQEPYLIFTYKLLDKYLSVFLDDDVKKRYYTFIEGVIDMYEDKSKCAVPLTLEEYREVLGRFLVVSA